MLSSNRLSEKMAHAQVLDKNGPTLIALAGQHSAPRESKSHHHPAGQLLGLLTGLMSVRTNLGTWVVPTSHAVWIPPSLEHAARTHGPFMGWAVYVSPTACEGLPDRPGVIAMTGLLREAVLRAAEWNLAPLQDKQQRLAEVILDEIAASPAEVFRLPMPHDPRLLRIALAIADHPADGRSLQAWAAWAHAAPRTVSRRFVAETGLTFTAWRQRARLVRALELLGAGEPVTTIALELGYDSASAFIALFRRTFGITPGRYMAAEQLRI